MMLSRGAWQKPARLSEGSSKKQEGHRDGRSLAPGCRQTRNRGSLAKKRHLREGGESCAERRRHDFACEARVSAFARLPERDAAAVALGSLSSPGGGREPRLLFEGLGEGGLLRITKAFGDLPHGKRAAGE